MESLAETAPLIERSTLLKDLVRCLRDDTRSGAIVVGGAGTGKTAVVKAALRELGPRSHVIRLTATPALAAVPFGALAPYLSGLPDRELDSYAAVVEAMAGSLRAEADRPLFVVDDAHCLDHGTVRQLAQAAATGAAGILATCLPGPMIPEEFLSLWDDGIIAKFDLAPLSRTGTHQLCEQVLRADVSPWVSAVFHDAADGNPLMLMSLIQHARTTGALGCRHGVWFLLANPDMARVPAADVVDRQLRSMTPEEKTAATIVALAGPLSLAQILRISGPKAVDALDTAGIIAVSAGHDRLVRPASPIVGEIIRHRVPAGRSSALRSSVLSLPSERASVPGADLNRLRWSLDCGVEIPPVQLLRAAVGANTALDPATAARAAGAIRDPRFLSEARIQLAYSHFIAGRPQAAVVCLESARPVRPGRPSYLAALLAARLGAATLARDAVTSTHGPGRAPEEQLEGGAAAAGLAAELLGRTWDGRFTAVGTGLRDLVETTGTPPEIRVPAISLLAELLTAQGQLRTGLRLDGEAWNGARSGSLGLPLVFEDLVVRHCLNLIRAGDWDGLGRVLDDYAAREPGRLLYSGGMLHLMRGYSRLRQGRMRECLTEVRLGVEELAIADPLNLLPFAHAVAAYAAAAVGRHYEASQHCLAFRLSVYREPKTLRLLAEAYCRAAEPEGAPDQGGASALALLADEALHEGLRGVETDIRRLAIRGGDVSEAEAEALALSSRAVDGPEARLLESYALAVSASDAADLIGISDDALGGGHGLLALEAAQQAERILADDPDRWRLTAVQRRVHHRLVEAGMSAQLEIVHSDHDAALTGREAEVLDLVSRGATNAEIASALCVSQRTVEGHLSRIFAKLGVGRRADLLGYSSLNPEP
ncbi:MULTISPECIES: helix-turn-helix transcriptional regulator [unclassified Arthrobacter]|uniref:helix-turn-helix transcriptional regulator n=1 Tax=unclassified Arthrobacter TaxID=235627 RepID=UPI001E15AC6D|nr:LuxR C-terminal-related transcriptional regulator [Arthrobacter sp. Bi26]CAH0260565.1 Transcriptional regulatory protein TdiR [Arthrobacter sp. Bi26]